MESNEKVNDTTTPRKDVDVNIEELTRYIPYSDDAKNLASSINNKLSMLAPDPLNYGTVCIYRVPEKYRKMKEEAYTPRLISIGPLHHEESHLQAMEEYKLKYLNNFLQTFRVPLELLAEYVNSKEKLVCGCYEDIYIRDRSKLLEMILLDGVFVVQLFLKNHFPEMREMGDTIFENFWVSNDILHDMLLLENQLPMRFTRTLYDGFAYDKLSKFSDDNYADPPSFDELAHEYLKNVGNTGNLRLTRGQPRARHLVEFLIFLHKPSHSRDEPQQGAKFEYTRSATALQEAGVRFRRGEEKCLFDVQFDKKGELRIPQLSVNDSTETFFRNLIALEQCGYQSKDITSYVILMDSLINTQKDVDLLIKHGIIKNFLGDSEQVADLFNNLYKEMISDVKDFYFAKLCNELNEYSRDFWHGWKSRFFKWRAMLRRDYFGNPWSSISVVAAVILLVLTVIQTICSILQVV